jgi:electron transfer flavoprotein beta subunit
MDILVLLKNVPEVAEADLAIDNGALDLEDLVYAINEWDSYAVEEAIRLKERHGGIVALMTLGDDEAEDVLRRGLAMGADEAIHLCDDAFDGSDAATLAKVLARAIGDRTFDLILAGVQSADLGQAQTGVLLAQELGLPFATMAVEIQIDHDTATVLRELESDTTERIRLPLPAVITVQSGINQPRYVSIMGIRKVRKIAIDQTEAEDLGFDEEQVGAEASMLESAELSLPQTGAGAEMLEGSLDTLCTRAVAIIREKGGLS